MQTHIYKESKGSAIKCDVYPAGTPSPVVVYIHGGGLQGGRRVYIPIYLIKALNNAGISLVSIDYRLAPDTKLPYILEDVRDALEWVRVHGNPMFGFDGGRVGVAGYSAGGYLTLMSGTFEKKPKVLVSCYGHSTLVDKEGEIYTPEREGINNWIKIISGLDRYADRAELIQYCPIHNITDDYPPVMFLHGDKDEEVPPWQSQNMHETLRERGLTSELLIYPGGDHGFDFGDDPAIHAMIDNMIAFLKKHL